MTSLSWTQNAYDDIDNITDYLDLNAPGISEQVTVAVSRSCRLLLDHPYIGEVIPEQGARKLTIGHFPYLLVYTVVKSSITILRVQHTARNWRG